MNLLITGGSGFIGSNTIQHIINRPEIERLINLDCLTYAGQLENLASVSNHPKYVFEKADLRDKVAVFNIVRRHRITHVLHLAAESHVDRSIACPSDFIETNILGTFYLLEACRSYWAESVGEHRFHHVSTDEVYGSLGVDGFFTESSPYAPNSPYSASKASSDMIARAYYHTYNLPVIVTNCSNNYGPYQFPEKLIPVVIQCVLARQPIPIYGDGMNVRDWLYVVDHADALWQVLTFGRVGETYNIGGGNEWTNLRIVELICDLFDDMAQLPGRPSRDLIAFVNDRPGHDRRYGVDASKLKEELGWVPQHAFEQGIRETIQWYLNHRDWVQTALSRNLSGHSHSGMSTS